MLRAGTRRATFFAAIAFDGVAYVNSVLQPGETVKVIGRLHWINYLKAFAARRHCRPGRALRSGEHHETS